MYALCGFNNPNLLEQITGNFGQKNRKTKKNSKKQQKKSSNKMGTLLGKIPCKTHHPEYQNSIKIEISILRPDSASPRRSVQFALVIVQLFDLFAM